MRRDLIIGIIASFLLHVGVFGSSYIKSKPIPPPPVEETPTIELMEMPPLEIEPEEINQNDEPAEQVEFTPPMQTDVPQLVTVDSFVQPIQPPPPENMKPNVGVIAIPTARQTGLGQGIEIFDISKLDQAPVPNSGPGHSIPLKCVELVLLERSWWNSLSTPMVMLAMSSPFAQPSANLSKPQFKP